MTFWKTQPLVKSNETIGLDGIIENMTTEASTTPESLPDEFEWIELSLQDDRSMAQICQLLNLHYTKDTNFKFKHQYTPELLSWMYGCFQHIMLGVRMKSNNVLVGLVCGRSVNMQVNRKQMYMMETNLLCVHPKLRLKKMTPVIVREFRRRCQTQEKGISCGFFVTSKLIGKPSSEYKVWTNPINIKKLLNAKYIRLEGKVKLDEVESNYKLPQTKTSLKLEPLTVEWAEEAWIVFNNYIARYNFHPIFTLEQFQHIFCSNPFVKAWIILGEDQLVEDFVSYYECTLASTKAKIRKACPYYYSCNVETFYSLLKNILVLAKDNGIDIVDVHNLMENEDAISRLQFDEGQTTHNMYLYNWKTQPLLNKQVGYCPI